MLNALIVDDEVLGAKTLETLLKMHCTNVNVIGIVHSADDAEKSINGVSPDVVFLDIEMPFANGDELAAKIKRVAPRQPILMITAFDRKPSLGNPVDAVLNKLFNSEQLRDTMTRLFSRLGENARSVEGNRIGSEDEAVIPSRNL